MGTFKSFLLKTFIFMEKLRIKGFSCFLSCQTITNGFIWTSFYDEAAAPTEKIHIYFSAYVNVCKCLLV